MNFNFFFFFIENIEVSVVEAYNIYSFNIIYVLYFNNASMASAHILNIILLVLTEQCKLIKIILL